ncbi:MAG TPA: hypothetical protein VFM27_02335 [Acidimicrobiales bacterium]|nr:hypothetical protein [Acidimicrobiales bacterium]
MPARALWIIVSVAVLVGLVAWSTTCTGPRPHPSGETLPPDGGTTTTVAGAAGTVPSTLAPPPS